MEAEPVDDREQVVERAAEPDVGGVERQVGARLPPEELELVGGSRQPDAEQLLDLFPR
jgi:hypothetical protein